MVTVDEVLRLFESFGHSEYGGECVTQLEHALQAAALAENEGASDELVAAALLHDIGHLLHDLPDDAPDTGIDDCHEDAGHRFLMDLFPPEVTEPIRLHVPAKRYLCAIDPTYFETLSPPSVVSLQLQGGPMTSEESEDFSRNPHVESSVRLRRWDDEAKDPDVVTPPLSHFATVLRRVAVMG